MSDFSKYVGRPYVMGRDDCYGLIRDYLWDQHQFLLPNFARPTRFWQDPNLNLYQSYADFGFRPVTDDTYEPGDVLLVPIRTPFPCHAALVVGDNKILHHVFGMLSAVDPMRPRWSNMATTVLRHPELNARMKPQITTLQLHEVLDAHVLRNPEVQGVIERVSSDGS